MILLPERAARPQAVLADPVPQDGRGLVPGWLRRAVPDAQDLAVQAVEDVAIAAGAAISTLDAVVRRQARWAGAWRQRPALSAAATTTKLAGRTEDEHGLRDAVRLTKPGDDVGPAGRMFLGWRRLAGTPAEKLLTEANIGALLEDLGLAREDEGASDLTDDLRQLGACAGTVGQLADAVAAAERHGFGRAVGAWLADALLAKRLGWTYAVALLGTETTFGRETGRPRRAGIAPAAIETNPDRRKSLLAAQARAALRAIDLSAELGRRAERLLAVAPKLRAKAADAVVERLLSDDAIVASEQISGISDRGLRRLFDRLVEFGAVRELSGRPTFRIYGI